MKDLLLYLWSRGDIEDLCYILVLAGEAKLDSLIDQGGCMCCWQGKWNS